MHTVTLKGITQPRNIEGINNAEGLIAYCARVSNPTNQLNTDTSTKLLAYLMREAHWSPFEMVNLLIEVKTTRDIGRQILRHRSFSFQEFSQRYAEVDPTMFVKREARLQDHKNRQNSIETSDDDLQSAWNDYQDLVATSAIEAYQWAIKAGIAKEQARVVLPEGMTPSVMYMNGTLRSWIHYCSLRMGNGTQKEHRLIADDIYHNIICQEFPSIRNIINQEV